VALADGRVAVFDLEKATLLDTWQFEPGSGALAVSLDGETLYLAAGAGENAEVLAIETASGGVTARFNVPGVYRIAAMYDGRALLTAGSDGLAEIVLATGELRPLPGSSPGSRDVVAMTPSWKHNLAFVTVRDEISIVYLPDQHSPYGTKLPDVATYAIDNRSGTRLFVSVVNHDQLLVLDTESFETTDTVPLGTADPRDVRFVPSPDGATLYLLDTATSQLSVIDLATKQATASVTVGGSATALGVSGDGEYVVVAAQDGEAGRLVVFNSDLQPLQSYDLPAPPVELSLPR
jgi:YVTN family beta-propeller protein